MAYRRFWGARRMAYRGQRRYRRSTRYAYKSSSTLSKRYLQVFLDPFSNASHTPRIPDGKVISSTGHKFHHRAVMNVPTPPTGQEAVANLLLQPCLTTPLIVETLPSTNIRETRSFVQEDLLLIGTSDDPGTGDWTGTQIPANEIFKWRVVSYGLHLYLLNTAEQNDGWFEAARVATDHKSGDYGFWAPNNTTSTLHLLEKESKMRLSASDIVNLPSYSQGRLREINNVIFSLHPDGNEHDFVQLRETYDIPDADSAPKPNAQYFPNFTDTAVLAYKFNGTTHSQSMEHFVHSLLDPGWDSVLVNLYCRSDGATQLLVHVVQNVELVYNDRCINSRFHMRLPAVKNFQYHSRRKSARTAAMSTVKSTRKRGTSARRPGK